MTDLAVRTTILSLSLALFGCDAQHEPSDADAVDPTKADSPGAMSPERGVDDVGEFDSFLSCWDGSFAYNTYALIERGDELEVRLSGANVSIVGYSSETGWNPTDVQFTVPASECVHSTVDPRLIRCPLTNVTATIFRALEDEQPFEVELEILDLETTFVTSTDATGLTHSAVELEVVTANGENVNRFEVAFPDYEETCVDDPAEAVN